MKIKKILLILILVISLFNISSIPETKGYTENVVGHYVIEKQISVYSDDAFLFVNSYFTNSTTAIPLNNNQYDIMIGLRFQDVGINPPTSTTYETIETCRLSFYTTDDYPVESGDTWVTIYGIKDSGDTSTFSSYQDMIDRELYFSHGNNVNFNTLVGDGVWWNTTDIRVSTRNIVKTTEKDIGFIIYASSGGASRLFRTFEHNSSLAVKLYIMVYQWEIYDPTTESEYIETYRGYDIFGNRTGYPLEPMEYVFTNGTDAPYNMLFDNLEGDGPFQIAETGLNTFGGTTFGGRRLIRTSIGTLWTAYVRRTGTTNQLFVKKSLDNGITWVDETQISNDWTHVSLSCGPSIAVDVLDNIHLAWWPYDGSVFNISYSMFNGTWSVPITISGGLGREGFTQYFCVIAIDSSNDVHIMWEGKATGYPTDQIWHREYYNESWGITTRASTYTGMSNDHQKWPSFTIDSNDVIQAVWEGEAAPYTHDQIWYSNYTDEWSYPLRLSTRLDMDDYNQEYPSIAVDSNDNIHVVWGGFAYGVGGTTDRIFYIKYTDSWSTSIIIPGAPGMSSYDQDYPSIAIDSNDYLHVAWSARVSGELGSVWYNNYTDEWLETAIDLQSGITEYTNIYPKFRWARYPETIGGYVVKDENGTIISPEFDTIEKAKEWINDLLSHSGGIRGDLIISLMGLAGFIMIPLSFIIFIQNMQSGDVENAFYMLMVLFFMGIAFIVTWLWG